VIVPGDPSLLSTPGAVADQHASWRVFILPVILFALVAVALVVLLARNRRRTPGAAGQPPGGRAVGA
jgi:anti-sigma-K factor RskA